MPRTAPLSLGPATTELELARASLTREVAHRSSMTPRRADEGVTVGVRVAPGVRFAPAQRLTP